MKRILFYTFLVAITAIQSFAGTLRGAWEMAPDSDHMSQRAIMVATENYLSITVFEKNMYIRSYGGKYEIKDSNSGAVLELTLEFNDKHSETVGSKIIYKYYRKGPAFTIENEMKTFWVQIDEGSGDLAGNWQITARAGQDGQMNEMKRGPRKTLKICSGTRFQWLAINPDTKEFSGTGGGTYTLQEGKYVETIEFFSRDNTRVGASLAFDAKVEGKKWLHSGKSSKGDNMNEIWEKQD